MMQGKSENPEHPGRFIKDRVIPAGISVTEAAKKLGVGRPALSNLLNGKASLSPSMAVKLEQSFGTDHQELLDRQIAFDRQNQYGTEKAVAARAHVPSFLAIKARQIHDWAETNHEARQLLPVLLRKLIHSTARELCQIDFPGYDNAERKGWDGTVEASTATPWIPKGKSGWEFGTSQRPIQKADSDYAARLDSVSPSERAECTFVFVTPRNWLGKTAWVRNKNAEGDWKDVRVFDASDLEQWLEESIPAQMWLAEEFATPVNGSKTLDQCWQLWEEASDPKMTPAMFEPSVIAYRELFKQWLKKPSERPFVVAADSRNEALAFLACLFKDSTIEKRSGDLAVVFESAQTLRTLAASSAPFIPIVCTDEAERALATVYRRLHCIIVRPRNAIDSPPDIALDPLDYKTFKEALADMGIQGDRVELLMRESGRSPTILRRRLSQIDAIRKPEWSKDVGIARSLIPMALVGAWHTKSNADCKVISTLDGSYQKVEESITRMLEFDDCPVWSVGQYRGVVSKIDVLFAIKNQVSEKVLQDFFILAENVLSESDPTFDITEDLKWVFALYGKGRDHSVALREGICETLVILSVYGNNLFRDRLGIDIENHVILLIRKLLRPLSLEKLLSHSKGLPRYAEAAPEEFLQILEEDLKKDQPVVLSLLKPTEGDLLDRCPRAGLLWALECLAWKYLGRVSLILAQLSKTVINDNWGNKPIASLETIYRSWLPQTAASLEDRIKALEKLMKKFPDIGWQICIKQLNTDLQLRPNSYRPRWRSDSFGAGMGVMQKEKNEFKRKAFSLALSFPNHNHETLSGLVSRLPGLSEEYQNLVWDLVDSWTDLKADEESKSALRDRIRRFAFTVHSRRHNLKDATKYRARLSYEKLQSSDPVFRHAWLFAKHWVEVLDYESENENFDSSKNDEMKRKLRTTAMKEIWEKRGFAGVISLLSLSEAPDTIGDYLAQHITDMNARADFLRQCFSITNEMEKKVDLCMQGFLIALRDEAQDVIRLAVVEGMDADQIVRLFRCVPFRQKTWRQLADLCSKEFENHYWQEVVPCCTDLSEAERSEIIDRLLAVNRPRAAFYAVRLDWSQIETSRLKRLLLSVATVAAEPAGHYMFEPYDIFEALNSLHGRTNVSSDEMAQIEFMFIETLEYSKHGIPNLERKIAESPTIFTQALAFVFKRTDGGQDPPEWRTENPEGRPAGLTSAAYRLLNRIKHIPGTDQDGNIEIETLRTWVTEVRQQCAEYGRADIGDQKIGCLLSKAPAEEDGSWPCIPVCDVMEEIASPQIGDGFNMGIHDESGAILIHKEAGVQERKLAAKYRSWAKLRAFEYPYISHILEGIAADYDREAEWWGAKIKIDKRLEN